MVSEERSGHDVGIRRVAAFTPGRALVRQSDSMAVE